MHILATPQPNFCHASGRRSLSSTPNRGRAWKREGNKDYKPYTTRDSSWKYSSNIITFTRRVCLGGGDLKRYALKQDGHVLLNTGEIEQSIEYTKKLLQSMDEGRISVSPYDTAWVALIKDVDGFPRFPSSLEWIANNQLSDGSWGDAHFFLAEDRLVNTLACVVAFRTWSLHGDKVEKGVEFVKENMSKLKEANGEYTTCAFELVFPILLQKARALGIDGLPYDSQEMREVSAARSQKLEKMSTDTLPGGSSLLYRLEGLENLDWLKLMKFQMRKGSFSGSPASTSFAVMQIKDENFLRFIENVVNKFHGGAPTAYPVDIFARVWAVDQLQRLGISRFFGPEIRACLDHVYRFWTDKGVSGAGESEFCDLDSTSMGFRLLRLHGYNVSTNALKDFKNGKDFTYYVGEGLETPSAVLNLHRASQVQFPGETLLEEALEFSANFLLEKLSKNQLDDKRLISNRLSDEIIQELEVPWCASLPCVEACFYIKNYAVHTVWIGKSLYRMPEINNGEYLELAKLDFNRCQAQHSLELSQMERWYADYSLEEFGISKRDLLVAYFLASASIFEPERSKERLAWVKSQVISNILSTYYSIKEAQPSEHSLEFPTKLSKDILIDKDTKGYNNIQKIIAILLETLSELVKDMHEHNNNDINELLHEAWGSWLKRLGEGAEEKQEAELLIRIVNICGGRIVSREILSHSEYKTLSWLTNEICNELSQFGNEKALKRNEDSINKCGKKMQLLLQLVLHDSSNGIAKDIKQTFLLVAKTFFYRAYFTTEQIDNHVSKILFERVM